MYIHCFYIVPALPLHCIYFTNICLHFILGFRIKAHNKDLRLFLDYLGQHLYLNGVKRKHLEGIFNNPDWQDSHMENLSERNRLEKSTQMLEYLIQLEPNQICFPKDLFYPESNSMAVETEKFNSSKKQKSFATDRSPINRADIPLPPEMLSYLDSIVNHEDEEETGKPFSHMINIVAL